MKKRMIDAHMKAAEVYAQLSRAERLKVGAIVVKKDRIISIGYNGTPAGWDNKCEDEDNKTLPSVIHAEANAIAKLAKSQESGDKATMFVTHAPCMECSKLIFTSGIKKVFYKELYRDLSGISFLEDCGVEVEKYNA